MLDPIKARLASSCSRKGINEAAIEAIWLGATSINSLLLVVPKDNQPSNELLILGLTKFTVLIKGALA
jgi:hypothetical protein